VVEHLDERHTAQISRGGVAREIADHATPARSG
jgi:hypothetical protein